MNPLVVWSDYACPYAYLGFRRLRAARPSEEGVEWRPYELHPEIPPRGVERPHGRFRRLGALAAADGARLNPSERVWNSRPALLAAEFAREVGLHPVVHERLFVAAWEEGLDLGRPDVLLAVGAEVGLDRESVVEAVRSQRSIERIVDALEQAMGLGITGTPSYLVGGRVLRGLQPIDALRP